MNLEMGNDQPSADAGRPLDPIEDPRVAAAVDRLEDLSSLPVSEHVEVFADVHARLTEALGSASPTPSEGS